MPENLYREVYFDPYCKTCKHKNLREIDEPCFECLCEPVNLYTHKPVRWEDKNAK